MQKSHVLLVSTLFWSFSALAVPCTTDGQCGYGKRCVTAVGERIGQCNAVKDKFGNIDRNAVGTSHEARQADAQGGSSRCNWDSDCGQSGHCVRKDKEISGMCVR